MKNEIITDLRTGASIKVKNGKLYYQRPAHGNYTEKQIQYAFKALRNLIVVW